ncbi:pentatricopeptide repeat-containing protein [Populus alba x Populus x berolinensis]|uniref:Pentatricopeptide repeat-containing protein n=1 Tax=Populus alba x Populus x berolinensis TaxID=444605 RepID=A0AAD6LTG4_9ROSI|nr:pentatricopeptide repeat-containing protein [Populus alba x Populus x berolinensis]
MAGESTFLTELSETALMLGRSEEACKYLEEMIEKGMKGPQLDYNKFAADFSRAGKPVLLEELAQKMKFSGKFEVSNVFARWAEMMKKRVKRREPGNRKCTQLARDQRDMLLVFNAI